MVKINIDTEVLKKQFNFLFNETKLNRLNL